MNIEELKHCRFCKGTNFETILDLGFIAPSTFIKDDKLSIESYPLILVRCTKCNLVQLKHTYDLDKMYRQYWYKTSLNPSMVKSLNEIVQEIEERIEIKDNDIIVDIGCNDGTMLGLYSNKKTFKIGFDPARNLVEENPDFLFINDYFPKKGFGTYPKAKVITSIAMFYDLPDIEAFMLGIDKYLADDGIWVIQFTDLLSMLRINAFDNICFEHLEYYSLSVLDTILNTFGLSIFDVSYNQVNGGSLRVYADRGLRPKNESVTRALKNESVYMNSFDDPFKAFAERVETQKINTVEYINDLVKARSHIYVLGASTKGNTLLQYYGINDKQIEKALEVNEDKFGLYTVMTGIPIVSDELINEQPDFILILPWHFLNFFESKYKEYLLRGGKFIVPLPELKVIGFNNGEIWEYVIKV